jgi:alanine racemase
VILEPDHISSVLLAEPDSIKGPVEFKNISIDSRSLQNNEDTLFFALQGPHHDAHDYIAELEQKGVKLFVVSHLPQKASDKVSYLLVKDTLKSLQSFAAWYRMLFDIPVIGITGSNGKTIVKEWLNFLLGPDYNIIRSPKSYNSQVGVPLSVIASNEKHNLGIFEAGISTKGEMEKLETIIRPDIGIFTNIGSAHDEGFGGVQEKLQEKLKLFARSKVVIIQNEIVVSHNLKAGQFYTWSFSDSKADILAQVSRQKASTSVTIKTRQEEFELNLPFSDAASLENAMHCVAVMLWMKVPSDVITRRTALLYPLEMRLAVKKGINGTIVIDDSYSSDFESLKIALDFLESQKQYEKKTLIISDIFQSGLPAEELYSRLSALVKSNKIGRVIGIGPTISSFADSFDHCVMYPDTERFLENFDSHAFGLETILVKGARSFGFERIVKQLEEKTHETVLEINLNAIAHNLNFYRSKIKPETKVMAMVKAFGYGSGGLEIARLLEHQKVSYLGVAFADEGIALVNGGITLPIMVLNPENSSFPSIIQYQLEPEIYSIKGLMAFIQVARQNNLSEFPIHIKLDTGMHRLGFVEKDLDQLIDILRENSCVRVQGILSHLATSDDLNSRSFAIQQIALYDRLSSRIIKELKISPIRHVLNTSGISNYPEAQYDMVRPGIGLYGYSNDPEEQKLLVQTGTLKSVISQIHYITEGESVGYNRRFVASKPTTIATIPIGYADGIARAWGNGNGFVTIGGERAVIVGSICMDMLMADVTHIKCQEGDRVIIFGESPTVNEMADKMGTIPYEILTRISQRVKRIFYRE